MLILIPTLVFSISKPKSIFGQIWAYVFCELVLLHKKNQSCLFCLKTGIQSISRMLILIPTLVSGTWNPKPIFGHIWAEKVKAICSA